MIQKLQTFTNFNNMNKFLPKARTALLSTVAAVGLGAMTSCSSSSSNDSRAYNISDIENVTYDNYDTYIRTFIDSAETAQKIKDFKVIRTAKPDSGIYKKLNINPNQKRAEKLIQIHKNIEQDKLIDKQNKNIKQLENLRESHPIANFFKGIPNFLFNTLPRIIIWGVLATPVVAIGNVIRRFLCNRNNKQK